MCILVRPAESLAVHDTTFRTTSKHGFMKRKGWHLHYLQLDVFEWCCESEDISLLKTHSPVGFGILNLSGNYSDTEIHDLFAGICVVLAPPIRSPQHCWQTCRIFQDWREPARGITSTQCCEARNLDGLAASWSGELRRLLLGNIQWVCVPHGHPWCLKL